MDLVARVYHVTKILPKEELYGLTNQLRRSTVSIPSKIAGAGEQARNSTAEFTHFLSIARGAVELDRSGRIGCAYEYPGRNWPNDQPADEQTRSCSLVPGHSPLATVNGVE
jgi:hypothetical protein